MLSSFFISNKCTSKSLEFVQTVNFEQNLIDLNLTVHVACYTICTSSAKLLELPLENNIILPGKKQCKT